MPNTNYASIIATELAHQPAAVARALLCSWGQHHPLCGPLPQRGHRWLDEEQLRTLASRAEYLRRLDERKETVLASIASQDGSAESWRSRCARPTSYERWDTSPA